MCLSVSSYRVASKILMLLFLSDLISPLYQLGLATSCGQPRQSEDDVCTNLLCSRILYASESNTSVEDNFGICARGLGEGKNCSVNGDCYIRQGLGCVQHVDKNDASRVYRHCEKVEPQRNAVIGYIGGLVACLGFGSMFVPTKKVYTGNGILCQFLMCVSILVISICISLVKNQYTFYPSSMLGGMAWAIANAISVCTVKIIGMALGLTLMMGTKLLTGWASGRFGWLGVRSEGEPRIPWLAYLGVFIGVVGILFFTLVKPVLKNKEEEDSSANNIANEQPVSEAQDVMKDANDKENEPVSEPQDVVMKGANDKPYSLLFMRMLGCALALISGFLYGINFNPSHRLVQYNVELTLKDSIYPLSIQYSPDGIDYVFSASLGIFMTSSIITVTFFAIRKYLPTHLRNKLPKGLFGDEVNNDVNIEKLLCPAFLSGGLWIFGQTGWFVANTNLGLTVSFPTISLGLCVVGNLWGILVFREIRGKRNLIIMATGFLCVIVTCFSTVFANLK